MGVQSYTLPVDQANSTNVLATIGTSAEPWTWTVPPGATFTIDGDLSFYAAANTTGLSLSLLVANPAGADGTALGSYSARIAVATGVAASDVAGGDGISVAANTSTSYTVTSTASTATPGDHMWARWSAKIRNFSTNANLTVTAQFASEVNASAVTLVKGSSISGTVSP